jgi:hypothetical protein
LRRLLLRRQQQSCASVSTAARLHALDRRLRSRGRYEGRDPRVQDVDPKLIGTWIQRSSGRGSRDHRDVDPEIIRTRIQYLRTSVLCGIRGPKVPVMVWDFFFPNFSFFLSFFPSTFSIENL